MSFLYRKSISEKQNISNNGVWLYENHIYDVEDFNFIYLVDLMKICYLQRQFKLTGLLRKILFLNEALNFFTEFLLK